MRSPLAALVVVALSLPAFSQEPPRQLAFDFAVADEPELSQFEKRLLRRIENLEKRLTALEAQNQQRSVAPSEDEFLDAVPAVPRFRQRIQPERVRARPGRGPARENVPDSWQRFEFNGQTFYIVPADNLSRGSGRSATVPAVPAVEPGSPSRGGDSRGSSSPYREPAPQEAEIRTPREVEEGAAAPRGDDDGDEAFDVFGELERALDE